MLKTLIKTFVKYIINIAQRRFERIIRNAFDDLLSERLIYIVDVGAAGDIAPRWKQIERHLSYVGFEPDDRSRELLNNTITPLGRYEIRKEALGETTGEAVNFNLCRKPQVSSSYYPQRDFLDLFPESSRFDIISSLKLEHTRLDELGLSEIDFIKIDTQGSELDVLKGASGILNSCLGLEIEVEFVQLYKDQPLFGEICSFLQKSGFEFVDFVNLSRWERTVHNGVGQCVFGDAIFFKTPENIVSEDLSARKLVAYIGCLLLYNRFDLIRHTLNLLSPKQRGAFYKFERSLCRIENRFQMCRTVSHLSSFLMQGLTITARNHLIY